MREDYGVTLWHYFVALTHLMYFSPSKQAWKINPFNMWCSWLRTVTICFYLSSVKSSSRIFFSPEMFYMPHGVFRSNVKAETINTLKKKSTRCISKCKMLHFERTTKGYNNRKLKSWETRSSWRRRTYRTWDQAYLQKVNSQRVRPVSGYRKRFSVSVCFSSWAHRGRNKEAERCKS